MTYPVFINLEGLQVAIVGGGRIAFRKIENMLGQGAKIKVVAPSIIDEIKKLVHSQGDITLIEENFQQDHLKDASLVFITSSNEEVNLLATKYCKSNGILMNNCMDSSFSSFRNGAVIRNGQVEIAIATGGKRPGIAKWLSERIDSVMPNQLDEIINFYDDIRAEAKIKFRESKEREAYIKEALKAHLETLEGLSNED